MSKTMILRTAFAAFLALWAGAAGAQERMTADKVVAVVGSSAILYSDVEQVSQQIAHRQREERYTPDRSTRSLALEQLLLQKLLYSQALVDSVQIQTGDLGSIVGQRIDQLVQAHGSTQKLEAFFHRPVFEIREELRRQIEEQRYAGAMQNEIQSKIRVTPGEVEKYFRSIPRDSMPIIPEQYVYAQITKLPSSTHEAKQRVREQLLEMRERVLKGTSFEVLARMYSMDGSASRGGLLDPTPKEGYVGPFSNAMVKLKEGQISEVVETEYGFHLIQMVKKEGNLYTVRHILLRPVFTSDELGQTAAQLDSVVREVRAGAVTFGEAALKHSDDTYTRRNGGLASNQEMLMMYNAYDAVRLTSTRFLKEELPVQDYNALRNLKPGDISDSFLTQDLRSNQMAKVVKLIEVIPSHPASLQEDYLRVEEAALEDKRNREFEAWLDKKIDGMYVRIDPEFRFPDLDNKKWLK